MNELSPQGPLIPSSEEFSTNFTRYLTAGTFISTTISIPYSSGGSIGTTLISGGILTGILDPINSSDAANKEWADQNTPGGIPGNPFSSIQFNSGTTFEGSLDLTFNQTSAYLFEGSSSSSTSLLYSKEINVGSQYAEAEIQGLIYVANVAGNSSITVEYINATTSGSLITTTVSTSNNISVSFLSGSVNGIQLLNSLTANSTVNQLVNIIESPTVLDPQVSQGITTLSSGSGLLLANGTITGLTNPVNPGDAVNKAFIDSIFTLNQVTLSSGATTYTPQEMINSVMYRNISTSTNDTTSDAISLLANFGNLTVPKFILNNISSDINAILTISPGTGVTFSGSTDQSGTSPITVYSGYTLTSQLFQQSTSSVLIVITGNAFTETNNSFIMSPISLLATNTLATDKLVFDTSSIQLTSQYVTYTPFNFFPIIYRNCDQIKYDSFGYVGEFISGYFATNSPINYIFNTGSIEFIIKNTSASYPVMLTSSANSGWTLDPNSNNTIGSGQTGYFYMYINTSTVTGNIYTIGIMDT